MEVLHAPSFDTLAGRDPRNLGDDEAAPHNFHRRIELQSPQDLLYLKNNVLRAAQAKIELHLPLEAALRNVSAPVQAQPDPNTAASKNATGEAAEDAMRTGVEMAVDMWITALFNEAKQNISVNGIDGEDIQWIPPTADGGAGGDFGAEEYEAYDTRLAARIAALYATIEQLNLELAEKRRNAASIAAKGFEDAYVREDAEMEAAIEAAVVTTEEAEEDLSREELGLWPASRQEDVRATWEEAVNGLRKVRTGLGETLAKAQRATEVAGALESGNSGAR